MLWLWSGGGLGVYRYVCTNGYMCTPCLLPSVLVGKGLAGSFGTRWLGNMADGWMDGWMGLDSTTNRGNQGSAGYITIAFLVMGQRERDVEAPGSAGIVFCPSLSRAPTSMGGDDGNAVVRVYTAS
jgi:hypothetical protein